MPPAIQIEQLTKDFPGGFWRAGPRCALDALTLDVASREVLGFPVDRAGVPYVLNAVTGLATVSTRSPYHPSPVVAGAPASARAAS